MKKSRERIFTFKTDEQLAGQLDRIANKSEFIRKAILAALEHDCPLCHGAGQLSAEQRKHWNHFLTLHTLEKCDECNAVHFVCNADGRADLQ
jgi:hypothetical protein